MIKKFLILVIFLFVALPCVAKEIYNDGLHRFEVYDVMLLDNGRELYYTLYVTPLLNAKVNDRYYKATITQFVHNGYANISKIYALDINGNYIHTDNTRDLIKNKIQSYKITLGNTILSTFTNCKEHITDLYCKPSN